MLHQQLPVLIGGAALALIAIVFFASVAFRTVVGTNQTHIVQRGSSTTSYGRGQKAGNTYYRWPAWLPVLGVRVTVLPVNIFDRKLENYAAYDIDRVPFIIDVVGFFRIADSNMAAERVKDFADLEDQLEPVLQGAARSILATSKIDEILGNRQVFSEKFTLEVTADLKSWGVEPVKAIELMDIRDANGSQVIAQIMAKKKSEIEMESRVTVAANMQRAQTAELDAKQQVGVKQQQTEQAIGQQTAAKEQAIGEAQALRDQNIGIAQQKANQAVQDEAKATAEKVMAVKNVTVVREAEIARDAATVAAQQTAQVAIKTAEGTKQKAILEAEGNLERTTREATGIRLTGEAKANAEQLMQMAPVTAQVTLAKEIGANEGYQKYLVDIKMAEVSQAVGIEQAKALEKASVKIVATANDAANGLNLVSLGAGIKQLVDAFKEKTKESA